MTLTRNEHICDYFIKNKHTGFSREANLTDL